MMRRNFLCIFFAIVLMITPLNTFALTEDEIISSMNSSLNESALDAQELLGDDVLFMTSNGKFYAQNEKRDYSDYGKNAYIADGKIMVDTNVLMYALNITGNIQNEKFIVGGKSFNATKKDGTAFVDAAELGKSLSMYVYNGDNRDFLLLSNIDRGYVNDALSIKNQETIDKIWRYMQFDRPDGEELYNALITSGQKNVHPRLLIKKGDVDALKLRADSDPYMKKVKEELLAICDNYIDEAVVSYKLDGFRLFSACGTVRRRLFNLCTAYLLTDNVAYAERAWEELENVCSWDNWNLNAHFLDSGRLGSGIAFAYDVLYDYIGSLNGDKRAWVRERVTSLYLNYCVGVYSGESAYKATLSKHTSSNWGAVTSASMLMTSLAFIDDEGENAPLTKKCKYIAENALQSLEHIVTAIAPEGAWSEGMGYYEYVLQHVGWSILSIKNITGNDYNFLSAKGLPSFPEYAMFMTTQNGSFNKGGTTGSSKKFAPEAMIYASLYNNHGKMKLYNSFYKKMQMNDFPAEYLLFCNPQMSGGTDTEKLSTDRYYETNGNTVIRESWKNNDGLYLAVSGGNGGHFDKGSFIFEALGERWSIDMGRNGNATMPYLKRTETHSALVINPSEEDLGQEDNVFASAYQFESKERGALSAYDLTEVYGERVESYKRGFIVADDRNTLTIRDEVTLPQESQLCWNMITRADIEISADKKSAVLIQNGKKLNVTAYCNAENWEFSVAEDLSPKGGWKDAETTDGGTTVSFSIDEQKEYSSGARKLVLKTVSSGDAVIEVKLSPQVYGEDFRVLQNLPIASWTIPDGEKKEIIKMLDLKGGDSFISGYDIPFSLIADGEFKSLDLYVNEEILTSVTKTNDDCRYSFLIPKSRLNIGGDLKIRISADYESYISERAFTINLIKEFKRNLEKGVDFSAFPDGDKTTAEIKKALGLKYIELKNGYGQISKATGLNGDCLKMQLKKGNAPYLQIAHEAGGEIIYLSFDAMSNKKDNSMYMSAFGGVAEDIFNADGTFLDGETEYKINTPYHIETVINMITGLYQIYITDENGNFIAKSDFKEMAGENTGFRITFRAASGEDGYFLIDNMNIATSEFMIVEDIKSGYDLDLSSGDKTVTMKVTNKTSQAKKPVLIISGYDAENKLSLKTALAQESIAAGESKPLTVTLKNDADLKCIKVFLWDDLQSLIPIKYALLIK